MENHRNFKRFEVWEPWPVKNTVSSSYHANGDTEISCLE